MAAQRIVKTHFRLNKLEQYIARQRFGKHILQVMQTTINLGCLVANISVNTFS
jgi:hypothetical protein